MSDLGVALLWGVLGALGAWRSYVDRVEAIDARRVSSFTDWIERPLPEPPTETDWEAFERRVERELRAAVRAPVDVVEPYEPPVRARSRSAAGRGS